MKITKDRNGQIELVKFLIEHGFTQVATAKIAGRPRSTISRWISKHQWKKKKEFKYREDELIAVAYLKAGYTRESVARKMNVTIATVSLWAKKHQKFLFKKAALRKRKIQPISSDTKEHAKRMILNERLIPRRVAELLNIPEKRLVKWIKSWKSLSLVENKQARK